MRGRRLFITLGVCIIIMMVIIATIPPNKESRICIGKNRPASGMWRYYVQINITEQSGKDLYNYQIPIELTKENFDFTKVNPNGSDIRFYDDRGNQLSYWIEVWNYSNYALIWVRVPHLTASSQYTIVMRFGNPTAAPQSNAENTFLYFDGTENGDVSIWEDVSDGDSSQRAVYFEANTTNVRHGNYSAEVGLWSEGSQSTSHARARRYLQVGEGECLGFWFNYSQFGGHAEPISFIDSFNRTIASLSFRSVWSDTYRVNGIDSGKVIDLKKWYKVILKNINYSAKTLDVVVYNPNGTVFDYEHNISFVDTNATTITYLYIAQSSWYTTQWAYYYFDSIYVANYTYPEPSLRLWDPPPEVSIITPQNGYVFNRTSVLIRWNGTDNIGIDHYEVKADNGSWIDVGMAENYEFSNLREGEHVLYVKAVDTAGNENVEQVHVVVDTTAPQVLIFSPASIYINSTSVLMRWNGTDNIGIDHYEVKVDSGSWIDVGMAENYEFTNLSEGEHVLYVKAVDTAGNEDVEMVNVVVDTTSPQVVILSPVSAYVNVTGVLIRWNGTDNIGIDHYEVRADNGSWIDVGVAENYEFSNLSEGEHVLYVKAVDTAGNEEVKFVRVVVDTDSPTISNFVITQKTEGLLVSWNATDNMSGISYYLVRIDDGEWKKTTDSEMLIKNISPGRHTIYIRAYDRAGNFKEVSYVIDVPSSTPWLWIVVGLILGVIAVILLVLYNLREKQDETETEKESESEPEGQET